MNDNDIFIGVMSGSSIDGLDIIACIFSAEKYQIIAFRTYEISSSLSHKLKVIRETNILDFLRTKSEYSIYIADCLLDFISSNNLQNINLVVIHGHTVLHEPKAKVSEQMVDGGLICSLIDLNVLVDLRIQDIGKGGEGAPLAPTVEKLINKGNCFINLGGICNISIHSSNNIIAYDISPCNQLLNFIAGKLGLTFDAEGKIGAEGKIIPKLLKQWNSIPYFNQIPPKSLDNNWIETHFLSTLPNASPADLLQTAYQFISKCIFEAIASEQDSIDKVVITGGGAHNKYLMQLLNSKISKLGIAIKNVDNLLINAKEALLMAYMGYLYVNNKPNTISDATGAQESVIAGGLYKCKPFI